MGTGSNTFGGTIKLEGEKEYREAISNINSDLKVFKSELKLVTSEFGANNKGAEALTAQNKILNSQIIGQKNKVEEYKSALKSLTNQQVENKNKMNETARQYDKSKEKLEAMKKSMTYTTAEIEKQEKEVKDLGEALKKSEGQYNSCDKKIDTWKISLNQAQVELNKMEKELSENEKAMKDYENATKKEKKQLEEFGEILDDGQEKVNVFGDVLKANLASEAIINGIKTMAGVVKDFTIEAFNFGVEYQQSLNQIKASTNMTAEEMQGLEQVMKDVYMDNFGESIDDVGNSLSVIRTQIKGLNDEDLKGITEDAIALRDTFQYEVNESVRSAKALIDHFGVSGKEAYTLIARGAQKGLDFSGEFLDNIDEYSVQFKKLGFSAEDMFNIFESGTKSGAFNLDKIGDAVKEFSIRAIDGSNTTVEGFQKLGLNADKMAKKFASGGETAKNAFFEVIQKIGAMDNKVEQSIVGVDLFGTMWEDLGPEVVTQLGSIRDGYDKTADTMKKINEVKYDDVGSALEGIKRKLIVSISEPINKDVLPIINKMANDVNWDKVGKKVSEVVGQIVGWIEKWVKKFENLNTEQVLTIARMGAFVVAAGPVKSSVEKVTSVFGASIRTMENFKTAINNVRTGVEKTGGQIGTFTKILSNLPMVAGAVAVGGLTVALLELTNREEEVSKKTQEARKSLDEQTESWEKLEQAAQEYISNNSGEIAELQNLREELSKITDENGNIKKGYEDRASFIVGKLQEATGTEISMNDNVIQSYQEVQKAVDDTINKKQAELLLSAYQGKYTDALKERSQAVQNLANFQEELTVKLQKQKEIEEKLEKQKIPSADLLESYNKVSEEINKLNSDIAKANDEVSGYGYTISSYGELQAATASGNAEKITEALGKINTEYDKAKESAEQSYTQQINSTGNYVETLKILLQQAKEAGDTYRQQEIQNELEAQQTKIKNLEESFKNEIYTIDTLGQEQIEAFQTLADNDRKGYMELLNKLDPDTRALLQTVTDSISSNMQIPEEMRGLAERSRQAHKNETDNVSTDVETELTATAAVVNNYKGIEIAMGNTAADGTASFDNNNNISQKMQEEVINTSNVLNNDTSVKSGGERLAGEIDTGFKSKSNGWQWGIDLVSNIADGLLNNTSIGKVVKAASGVASAIKGILGHSVPTAGPLKDELTYMPDMIDNLSRTMLQASPQLKKATLSIAEMMSSNLSNLQVDTGIKKSLNNALNFNTIKGIKLSKASMNTNFEASSYKNNNRNNLDIDTLTYAFKTALKDMTGKVVLDDEKMGKFVIEKVEEAIY